MASLEQVREWVRAGICAPATLGTTIARMGFVQADPIRAPARAQDLILRHRVAGYRVGDLERGFRRLRLEEDFLYAYGFMPREVRDLLHPRLDEAGGAPHVPAGLAAEVLTFVRQHGPTHPRALEAAFGRERAVNAWGGFSQASTRALESLRHYGLVRVRHRRDGIRIYEAEPAAAETLPAAERAQRLVMLVARLLAPVPEVSLRGALALMARHNRGLGALPPVIAGLCGTGALRREMVDGVAYLWPEGSEPGESGAGRRDVRLLSPFDPVVWDRRRFEHLWGWPYRFEAYVPATRRERGYYAMPMLWWSAAIGWANVSVVEGKVRAALGFAGRPPGSQAFARALEAEIGRMERFLTPRSSSAEEGAT